MKEADEEDAKEVRALAAKIKRREENPTVFLSDNDGVFQEDEIKKKARAFVIEYLNGSYMDELRAFAQEKLQTEIHGEASRIAKDYMVAVIGSVQLEESANESDC